MYQIAKEKLPELFRKITQTQELYLPVEACGQVNYAPWSEDAKVDLDTLKTVKSAKDAFSRKVRISIPATGTERRFPLPRRRYRSSHLSYLA